MSILKCKMCGGNLEIAPESTVAVCEYCGTKQTVPSADNEKKMMMFERANKLRYQCEFDKAAGMYESIITDFPYEAEAYWGLILCKYGIEYVDDPATGRKIPTCHRSSFDSVMEDSNFERVMENADAVAVSVYREEAKAIENLRKSILEVSSKEDPYDIFICYKETDDIGNRTIDSVIAQNIYTALTNEGYRVFFARISLEDKLGTAYEPYIFAALNSAKVMLAVGTSYDYYNAVWVKNEWSRFLQLIAKGEKKTLIPCYKDIDAYDIPKEFKHLQAQDMGKVGSMQDLLRGINKINPKSQDQVFSVTKSTNNNELEILIKRGNIALEDGEYSQSIGFFNKALDINPECASAYVGLEMAERRITDWESFTKNLLSYSGFPPKRIERAYKYATGELKTKLSEIYSRHEQILNERREKQEEHERIKRHKEAKRPLRIEVAKKTLNWFSVCDNLVVARRADGTALCTNNIRSLSQTNNQKFDVSNWKNVKSVWTALGDWPLAIKEDGSLILDFQQRIKKKLFKKEAFSYDISSWGGLKKIALKANCVVGLHERGMWGDGSFCSVFFGKNYKWISELLGRSSGIDFCSDGFTSLCIPILDSHHQVYKGDRTIAGWDNIEQISLFLGCLCLIGTYRTNYQGVLKYKTDNLYDDSECEPRIKKLDAILNNWDDVISISTCDNWANIIFGLTENGKVRAASYRSINDTSEVHAAWYKSGNDICDISNKYFDMLKDYPDVLNVYGQHSLFALLEDGTIFSEELNGRIPGWKLFDSVNEICPEWID